MARQLKRVEELSGVLCETLAGRGKSVVLFSPNLSGKTTMLEARLQSGTFR
jgi:ABC-type cobalamin/Fe3+-siderophores transport system ATPase subunit